MFVPPNRFFEVKPTQKVGFGPVFKDDENLKKLYGVELAKTNQPFDAACNVFPNDTAASVYISINWINDPVVTAARDTYIKAVEQNTPLLDKDQFAARLLHLSEEKDEETGRYLIDAKDRLKALELYAKTMQFIDAPEDHSNKTFINSGITIKIVKPEIKEEKIIEHSTPELQTEAPLLYNALPVKLKLVG